MKPRSIVELALPCALVLVTAGALPLVACSGSAGAHEPGAHGTAPAAAPVAQEVYTCPMHPAYRSDRPGDCPICNMRLVRVEEEDAGAAAGSGAAHDGVHGRVPVSLPPERARLIGLQTSLVERRPFTRTIRAAGRVEPDERGLSAVSLKTGGWIETLRVQAVGERVEPGQVLFELYSPELYEAQKKYLLARELLTGAEGAGRGAEFERGNVASARVRLELLDMSAEQIAALDGRSEPERRTAVLARTGGVVTRRAVVQGARVEAGATLLELADLSTVWVQAELYENELPLVPLGTPVEIELDAAPGETLPGTVAFLDPVVDGTTRTARARIELANPDGRVLPGMFARVSVAVDLGESLVVDDDAILDTGLRQLVFVDLGEGRFAPREVTVGARAEGAAQVLSGLEEGERVVSHGTFLVDSESRLKAAMARHTSDSTGGGHAH